MSKAKPTSMFTAKLSDLKQQVDDINLPALREYEQQAISERDAYLEKEADMLHHPYIQSIANGFHDAVRQAKSNREGAERSTAQVQREIDQITRWCNAAAQVAPALAEIEKARAALAATQTTVDAAQAAVDEIDTMMATEQAAYDRDVKTAGEAMLRSVQSGGKVTKPTPASRGHLDTLGAAREVAMAELTAARAAHEVTGAALVHAEQDHAAVVADAAEHDLQLLARGYAAAVLQYRRACHAVDRDPNEPHIEVVVSDLVAESGDDCPRPIFPLSLVPAPLPLEQPVPKPMAIPEIRFNEPPPRKASMQERKGGR